MVPRFAKPGKSFKAVALYLMHDMEHATTSERVAWTHTLNLAHDHIPSAVDEMLTTFENAGLLKVEQGAKLGAATQKPVKHLSLNWHPSEQPDKEAMIAAAQSFLKYMGWDEHQAMLIAHTDKKHRHVHLVVNTVHPETGRKLDDGFELRRAQAWAHGYEKEHGKIFCTQREKNAAEREPGIPRPAWEEIKERTDKAAAAEIARAPFDPSYMAKTETTTVIAGNEWDLLKQQQKEARQEFVAEGKGIYRDLNRAIYREVREECREDWANYYAAKRDGLGFDTLADIRQGLIDRQKAMREERFAEASAPVRAERDLTYRDLLDAQKAERAELRVRQARGVHSPDLLDKTYGRPDREEKVSRKPHEPARAANANEPEMARLAFRPAEPARSPRETALDRFGIKRGRPDLPRPEFARPAFRERGVAKPKQNTTRDFASGIAGGLLAFIGGIGESLSGGHSAPEKKAPAPSALDRFGIKRGRPPPQQEIPPLERERLDREAWYEWQKRRDPDVSRSG